MPGNKTYFKGKDPKDLSERYIYQKEHGQTPNAYRNKTRDRVRNWTSIPLLVTVTEMAALLRVQEQTLRQWRSLGLDENGYPKAGPRWTRLTSNKTVYRKEDIEEYFQRCQYGEVTGVNKALAKMEATRAPKFEKKAKPKPKIKRETVPAHLAFRK